ncbi:MAG: DUF2752 domain-containing protein [Ignavibacteriales bacterium]|nr:DUF2752 domain-containing protein [Ignavibacteriales bacterium]
MKKIKSILKIVEWEGILWMAGLIYLVFINPYQVQYFTLCPFHNLGISFCPGCGLGRSISFFYHADLFHSIKTHPLGIIAFLIINARIIKLFIRMYNNYHKSNEVIYG